MDVDALDAKADLAGVEEVEGSDLWCDGLDIDGLADNSWIVSSTILGQLSLLVSQNG